MIFGSITCNRCGKVMDVNSVSYDNGWALCPECSVLGQGEICGECKRYCVLSHKCSYEDIERGEDKVCCCAVVRLGLDV